MTEVLTLPLMLALMLILPATGAILLAMLGKRMGEPLSGYIGTTLSAGTFAASVGAMVAWISGGSSRGFENMPWVLTFGWLPIHQVAGQRTLGFLDAGIYVDSLGIIMCAMVTFITSAVHLYSLGYMRGDSRYWRFFALLSFFSFSMLMLILSVSLIQMLVFWELVGVCSYLLIGFWYEDKNNTKAALKAFLVNRVGDVAFIVAIVLLVINLGTTTFPDLWLKLATETSPLSPALMTTIGVLLFMGAAAKSAQFPLHVWLPDAMAAPTPVSALIHAATMVAAGVFMLARVFPILTPDTKLFIAIIGSITILMGALCAITQRDIKKVLAFSTMSQLGYMVLALGLGSWTGAMFHLLTHAFFKALLFLCAGSVINAMHHETDIAKFGGLWRRLPVTAIAFFVGVLAISGAPFMSGFYSKDMILAHASAYTTLAVGRSAMFQWFWWLPVVVAYVTPIYMMRVWMLTFVGRPRDRELHDAAGESGILSFPLVVLSGMSLVAGYTWFPVQSMVVGAMEETRNYFTKSNQPLVFKGFDSTWPTLGGVQKVDPDVEEVVDVVVTPAQKMVEAGYVRTHHSTAWAWLIGLVIGGCGVGTWICTHRPNRETTRYPLCRSMAGKSHVL